MKIIYLSGPMKGIADLNFPEFNRVAWKLRDQGYTVINPVEIGRPGMTYAELLREDIKEMIVQGADTIAILKGWENSAGAILELVNAIHFGMQIVDAYTLDQTGITDVELKYKVR